MDEQPEPNIDVSDEQFEDHPEWDVIPDHVKKGEPPPEEEPDADS